MTRTLPKVLQQFSDKKYVIRYKGSPYYRLRNNNGGDWYYCYRNKEFGSVLAWRQLSLLRYPIIGKGDVIEKFDKMSKMYGDKIELVEFTKELSEEFMFWKLKSVNILPA